MEVDHKDVTNEDNEEVGLPSNHERKESEEEEKGEDIKENNIEQRVNLLNGMINGEEEDGREKGNETMVHDVNRIEKELEGEGM